MMNTYEFVLLSGKRLQATAIDEFNAFLSVMRHDDVCNVDYYGVVTKMGLRDIQGGDYLSRGLKEFVLAQDEAFSLALDEWIAAKEDESRSCLSETEPNDVTICRRIS